MNIDIKLTQMQALELKVILQYGNDGASFTYDWCDPLIKYLDTRIHGSVNND